MNVVDREKFLRRLNAVRPGLAPREQTVIQSSCFCFRGGEILTYNGDVCCRGPSGLDDSVEGAWHAKTLIEVLEKVEDEELVVQARKGVLTLAPQGKRVWVDRNLGEVEVVLPVEDVEGPGDWLDLDGEFLKALAAVEKCAREDDREKVLLTCVHLHPKWIEATDRQQVIRYRVRTGLPRPAVVRRDYVKPVIALGVRGMALGASWLHFRNDEITYSCRLHGEDYWDLSEHLGGGGEKVIFPKKAMGKVLERCRNHSAQNVMEDFVTVYLGRGRMRVVGEGVRGSHEATVRNVSYSGPELTFAIKPLVLAEVVRNYQNWEIAPTFIRVVETEEGVKEPRWVYKAALAPPPGEEGECQEEEEAVGTD